MMRRLPPVALALLAFGSPALAPAQDVGAMIKRGAAESGKAHLVATNGYILLTAHNVTTTTFLRVPDDDTRRQWQSDREAAFAKALKKFKASHAQWLADADIAKKTGQKPPAEPIEPTIDTFGFDPIELRDVVTMQTEDGYAKVSPRPYIAVVKPGTYIVYAHDGFNGGSPIPDGECFCMGTVRFEVKPGVVTDLGTWLDAMPRWTEDTDVVRLLQRRHADAQRAAGKRPELPDTVALSYGLPNAIKDWPSVKAEFHANGKVNNMQGMLVSRMAPVPGVLAYDRDRVIDAATGQPLPDPAFRSMQKIKP